MAQTIAWVDILLLLKVTEHMYEHHLSPTFVVHIEKIS
jgi:hypothetical protein